MQKAWVLHRIGEISLENREKPIPAKNEVCVKVKAAGICGSDIPRIYETGAHKMPLIPGHEFSGIIESVSDESLSEFVGKRVAVYPKIACGSCKECESGKPELCQSYDYVGSRRDGAFSEYVNVPWNNTLIIPDNVSFEKAAMMEPLAVAANAVRRSLARENGETQDSKSFVICGFGTIGSMVALLLLEKGYKNIYVIGNKESQKTRAVSIGISEENFCDSSKNDAKEWIREHCVRGVDTFFECVGKNECISLGIESLLPEGVLVLVGNPYSDMYFEKNTYWQVLRKQLSVIGIWNSSFSYEAGADKDPDDWHYVRELLKKEDFHPEKLITHRLGLEDLEKGFLLMKSKSEDYCKVMMVNE